MSAGRRAAAASLGLRITLLLGITQGVSDRLYRAPIARPTSSASAAPLNSAGNPLLGHLSMAMPPRLGPMTPPRQYTMTNRVFAVGRSAAENSAPNRAIP